MDTKLMLNATLLMFSAFAFIVAQNWQHIVENEDILTANTIGIFAGVEENSINKIALELDEREKKLDAREMALIDNRINTQNKTTLLIVSLVGTSLFGLILLNFYLDSRKRMSFIA